MSGGYCPHIWHQGVPPVLEQLSEADMEALAERVALKVRGPGGNEEDAAEGMRRVMEAWAGDRRERRQLVTAWLNTVTCLHNLDFMKGDRSYARRAIASTVNELGDALMAAWKKRHEAEPR